MSLVNIIININKIQKKSLVFERNLFLEGSGMKAIFDLLLIFGQRLELHSGYCDDICVHFNISFGNGKRKPFIVLLIAFNSSSRFDRGSDT